MNQFGEIDQINSSFFFFISSYLASLQLRLMKSRMTQVNIDVDYVSEVHICHTK